MTERPQVLTVLGVGHFEVSVILTFHKACIVGLS